MIPRVLAGSEPAPGVPATGTFRILIADDEEADRYALRALLPRHVEIYEAHNGREAIEQIAALRPTLVFLDLNMPEMDGIDVLRRLRETGPFPDMTVVVHTSRVLSPGQSQSIYDLGATAILSKGYDDLDARRTEITTIIQKATPRD